jgi:N-acetylmuramoyl-L-alanine amidase
MHVKYLFFHTAAADLDNVDAAEIRKWHRAKGWQDIGYHFVIIDDRHKSKPDGMVETGRPETQNGAHVRGVNDVALGVCCAGHGDLRDFTAKQKASLVHLLAKLAEKYGVKTKNILGHREINKLIDAGKVDPQYRTTKTCPGTKVSPDDIRAAVALARGEAAAATALSSAADEQLRNALLLLAQNESRFGNAAEEWRNFFYNGEIRALVRNG